MGLVPEVFVAPPATLCLDGRLPGASLHLPLTLAHILTGPQLHALVIRARARASAENAAAARLVETWSALTAEHESLRRTRGVRLALALPTLSVLALVLETYAEAEAALERQQQVAADRAAADTCGARTCGVAILKEAAFGPAWPAAVRQMREAVREGSQYPNARVLFAELVAANADTARVGAALHPDAATPPTGVLLRRRLELLGLVPEDLVAEALDVQPAEPAAALAGADLAPVEERLTSFVHLQLLQASHA